MTMVNKSVFGPAVPTARRERIPVKRLLDKDQTHLCASSQDPGKVFLPECSLSNEQTQSPREICHVRAIKIHAGRLTAHEKQPGLRPGCRPGQGLGSCTAHRCV
ncbi:hypothetical protein EMIT0P258_120152 [Pseudomonas sp. IT-P258]